MNRGAKSKKGKKEERSSVSHLCHVYQSHAGPHPVQQKAYTIVLIREYKTLGPIMLPCHAFMLFHTTSIPCPLLIEIERIPAQRASARIARLEPLEQTAGVVHVLARRAALLRQLAVAADDAVADRALGLALECAHDVAAERRDAVGDGAVL
jgi:hypothetical protein